MSTKWLTEQQQERDMVHSYSDVKQPDTSNQPTRQLLVPIHSIVPEDLPTNLWQSDSNLFSGMTGGKVDCSENIIAYPVSTVHTITTTSNTLRLVWSCPGSAHQVLCNLLQGLLPNCISEWLLSALNSSH